MPIRPNKRYNVLMTEDIIRTEAPIKENLLEGTILVHGFQGNIRKPEIDTLIDIVKMGALVSPNLRELTPDERKRSHITPFDQKRVVFHAWRGNERDNSSYIGYAAFAAPVTILAGNVITEDPSSSSKNTIAVYNETGVRIPLEAGILFMSEGYFSNFLEFLKEKAQRVGMNPTEYVNKYIVILSPNVFRNFDELKKAIFSRIDPATNVTADIVTHEDQIKSSSLDYTRILRDKPGVTRESLGTASTKGYGIVDQQQMSLWEEFANKHENLIREVSRDPSPDQFRLKEVAYFDICLRLERIQNILELTNPNHPLLVKVHELNKLRAVTNNEKRETK